MEPGWGRRAHARGKKQEEAQPANAKAIVACARGMNGYTWAGRRYLIDCPDRKGIATSYSRMSRRAWIWPGSMELSSISPAL